MTDAAPLGLESVVVAARDQVSAEVEGEAVILNLADSVYYGLDGVGARAWALLREPVRVAALRDAITAEYDVDAATAARDLLALLDELRARCLVEVVSDCNRRAGPGRDAPAGRDGGPINRDRETP